MTQTTAGHGPSLMLVRRMLDQFCKDHGLALSDVTAVEAARRLISLAVTEEAEPEAIRRSVEAWYLTSHPAPDRPVQAEGPAAETRAA